MSVFLCENIFEGARKRLESHYEIVNNFDDADEIEAIILRVFKVDKAIMDKCKNLRLIAQHGVGCDSIDLKEAKRRGITVLNTPGINSEAVAEMIVGLAIDISRNITLAYRKTKDGDFPTASPPTMIGTELHGKTVGLIGTGHIARLVAHIFHDGFNMEVLGYNPHVSKEKMAELGYKKYDSIQELIKASDIVNVSVPLTPETKNLIAGKTFDCFKPSAILINAARGGIVNEDDLYDALKERKLHAAACDAFVNEPPSGKNTKLFELDNFVGTPHIGGCSKDALIRVGNEVVDETLKVLSGGEPSHRVI